jgi:hypothetical protein
MSIWNAHQSAGWVLAEKTKLQQQVYSPYITTALQVLQASQPVCVTTSIFPVVCE